MRSGTYTNLKFSTNVYVPFLIYAVSSSTAYLVQNLIRRTKYLPKMMIRRTKVVLLLTFPRLAKVAF